MSYAYNYIRSLRIFTLMKLYSQFNILSIKYQQFEENQCLKRQLSQYSYFIWKPPIISVFFNFTHHTNLHNIKACVQIYILSRILAIYRFILEHWVYSKLCQDINRKILSFLPLLPFSVKSINFHIFINIYDQISRLGRLYGRKSRAVKDLVIVLHARKNISKRSVNLAKIH